MTELAILTEELSKSFGAHAAVQGVNLAVRTGEVFGFLGPNGAGKTTTIGMLLALIRPTSGRALVLGHDVARAPGEALRDVGALVEGPAFYPYLSGRDNLRVLAHTRGAALQEVDAALELVDLAGRARDPLRTYSQGQRQRLGLAAALMHEPRLVLLDEPTNGLDPAGQHEIRALIRNLANRGQTVFLSSHLLHEVEQLCDRVAILKQGRVIAEGPVAELLGQGRGILVRTAELARATEVLRGMPWIRAIREKDGLLLLDAPAERSAEINTFLAAHGIAVAEIRAFENRLEDVFLELTRS